MSLAVFLAFLHPTLPGEVWSPKIVDHLIVKSHVEPPLPSGEALDLDLDLAEARINGARERLAIASA